MGIELMSLWLSSLGKHKHFQPHTLEYLTIEVPMHTHCNAVKHRCNLRLKLGLNHSLKLGLCEYPQSHLQIITQ